MGSTLDTAPSSFLTTWFATSTSSSTNGFIIAHIDPASVIDRDGRFRVGDKIIRINGHDLVELTISQVREILKHSSNQVEIEVIRDPEDKSKKTGTKLNKSESLRIFRAVPSSQKLYNKNDSLMVSIYYLIYHLVFWL